MPPLKMFLLLGAAKMLNSWDTLVTKLDSYYIKKKTRYTTDYRLGLSLDKDSRQISLGKHCSCQSKVNSPERSEHNE